MAFNDMKNWEAKMECRNNAQIMGKMKMNEWMEGKEAEGEGGCAEYLGMEAKDIILGIDGTISN